MSAIRSAFEAGDLQGAVAAATAAVKAAPRDFGARWVLAEMLLFAGELERADRALDAIILEEPSPAVLEFRRLLRAAEHRRRVFGREGAAPKLQGEEATPAQTACLRALVELRAGNAAAAAAAAAEAEAARPRVAGTHAPPRATAASVAFDDLRDADDLFSPFLEVLTVAGDYLWVPIERIRSLAFETPRRPRDLCWRRATIEMKDGQEGVVFVPAIYPWGDPAGMPDALRLGRTTDWPDAGEGPVRGLGQRLFLAGEEALPVNEIGTLHFA
ncbi:type VI secretion system accessory protein TagJ [Caldovatus aquaticus]|uniref:Tetratricopeptide repeat protein n=1 Tax=Caldovatus aquaticus TaxID=2865671 RepID=A0ABS7F3Q0_9PROT|nr:type VI secretion system accessory protein TagJ [Caldovatus aquaticus]MBW8270240.1 tetratricopeptide repeat protein [Caldovatus aquaticus]